MNIKIPTMPSTFLFANLLAPSKMARLLPSSVLWEMPINRSTVSVGRRLETFCSSSSTIQMRRQSCWNRTIDLHRIFLTRLTLLLHRMLPEKRRTSGQIQALVHHLSVTSLNPNMMKPNSLRMRFVLSNVMAHLNQGIPQFSIAPTPSLASSKKSLCGQPCLTK